MFTSLDIKKWLSISDIVLNMMVVMMVMMMIILLIYLLNLNNYLCYCKVCKVRLQSYEWVVFKYKFIIKITCILKLKVH